MHAGVPRNPSSSIAGFSWPRWPVSVAVAGVCALTARPLDSALLYIIAAFIVGFMLPRFFLNRTIRKRQRLIRWGLAALDLMVVSVEAGLGLNAAMVKVATELREVHYHVAAEFELANLEIRVGRERDEALRNLSERTGVDDMKSIAMLIQTDKFGTSIAKDCARSQMDCARNAASEPSRKRRKLRSNCYSRWLVFYSRRCLSQSLALLSLTSLTFSDDVEEWTSEQT